MYKRVCITLLVLKLATCAEIQLRTQKAPLSFESRRIRQLDLSLQDVAYSSERPINILGTGDKNQASNPDREYLPPRNIQAAGASIDETVLKPNNNNPHHHGRDLCTDPFHSFLCDTPKPRKRITGALPSNLRTKYADFYGNSIIGANSIPAPSRVLAPPDNDLEQTQRPTTYYEPSTQQPSTTTEYFSTVYTTYPTTYQIETTTEIVPAPSNNKPKFVASSNDNLVNYLPPETAQPTNQVENEYLPPRESFQPTNKIEQEYLPPRDVAEPTNKVEQEYLPPRVAAEPTNKIEQEYLPPRDVAEPTNNVEQEYLPPKETAQPTNQVENEYLPPPETAQSTNQVENEYLPPVEAAQPTNENPNTYLPPRFETAAAAQPDVIVLKPEEEHKDICSDAFHAFLCTPLKKRVRITGALPNNLVAQNSFLNSRRVYSKPTASPLVIPAASSNNFRSQPPFENILRTSDKVEKEYLPPRLVSTTTTTKRPIILNLPSASNAFERGYLPPPSPAASNEVRIISSTLPTTTSTTTRRPTTTTRRYTTTTTTRRPTTTSTTTRRPPTTIRIPSSTVGQATNNIRAYLPPEDPKFDTAAAVNDVTVVKPEQKPKDLCSDAFHSFLCTTPIKRTRITGDLPASRRLALAATNTNQQRTPFSTSTFRPTTSKNRAPFNTVRFVEKTTFSQPRRTTFVPVVYSTTRKPVQADVKIGSQTKQIGVIYSPVPAAATNSGYVYNKPSSSLNNQGYAYPKPETEFPLPSQQNVGYEYPKPEPELPQPSEENPGYEYQKPEVEFISTTTEKEGYDYPKPEKELVLPTNQQEYNYPKPEQELPLPSEQAAGYDYPKPDKEFVLPSQQNGYDYPKPEVEFVLPTEQRNQYQHPAESRTFVETQVPVGLQDNSPWTPILPSARTETRQFYYRKREVPAQKSNHRTRQRRRT